MPSLRRASTGFLIVTMVSVGAAMFRVATTPDRVRDSRAVAHKTCVATGGDSAVAGQTATCRKPDEFWLSGL